MHCFSLIITKETLHHLQQRRNIQSEFKKDGNAIRIKCILEFPQAWASLIIKSQEEEDFVPTGNKKTILEEAADPATAKTRRSRRSPSHLE